MSRGDYIALGAFILSLILALCAFVFWLINITYKINRFIFDLISNIDENTAHARRYENLVYSLNKKVDYLKHIIILEFPQYFKKNDEADN